MCRTMVCSLTLSVSLLASIAVSDEIKLTNGNIVTCTVLQETDSAVTVLIGDGVIRIARSEVASVGRPSSQPAFKSHETASGIPSYGDIVRLLARQSWAIDLHPIPATVVDSGPLKNVPYKSHRVATNCEVNIYGDPSQPACVEVGLFNRFLNHAVAKERCIEFVSSLLEDETSRAIVLAMKKDKDLVKRAPLTFEITPSTADDAYGGWWISVYNESLLDSTRATAKELSEITTPRRQSAVATNQSPPSRTAVDDWHDWHPSDFAYARSARSSPPSSSTASTSGRVYVHGYTRKDGTYVHAHTRSK
jgi:hypothetical protein